nr:MAG TPA: tail tape measure [Caudoviricetes sp.]
MAANFDVGTGWVSIVPKMGDFSQIRKQLDKEVVAPSQSWGQRMGSRITSGLKKTMKVGATAVTAAAGVGAGKAFSDGFNRLVSTDRAEKALEGLGYKGNEITKIMGNVNKSIEGTSFLVGDTAQVASVMLGSGIKPGQELQDTLSHVADAAAHSNTSISEMGSIWSKVAARGHLDGEVMNQLMYHGIGVQEQLAKQMGVSKDAVADMVRSGKISFADFSQAMDSMFHGAAQKQRETLTGSFQYMSAFASHVTAGLIEPLYNGMIPVFNALAEGFQQLEGNLGPVQDAISAAITPALQYLADTLIPHLFESIQSFDMQAAMEKVSGVFHDISGVVTPLIPTFWDLAKAVLNVTSQITVDTWTALIGVLNALAPIINAVVIPALDGLAKLIADHPRIVTPVIEAWLGFKAIKAIAGPVGSVIGVFRNLGGAFTFAKSAFAGAESIQSGILALTNGVSSANPIIRTFSSLVYGVVEFITGPLVAAIGSIPIVGWIAIAVAAISGFLIWFFTKTETGKKWWANIVEWFKSTWEAISDWWQSTVVPILQGIGGFFAAAWEKITIVAGVLGDILAGIVAVIMTVLIAPLFIAFNLLKYAWDGLVMGIQYAWENWLLPLWESIKNYLTEWYEVHIEPIFRAISDAWGSMVNGISTWWNETLMPTWNFIKAFVQEMYEAYIAPIFQAIADAWSWMVNGIIDWWNSHLLPMWEDMKRYLYDFYSSHIAPIFRWIGDRWNDMANFMGQVKDWIVQNVFGGIRHGLDVVRDAFGSVVNAIRDIWGRLREATAKPARFVIETVWNNGILKAWNAVVGMIGKDEWKKGPVDLGNLGNYASGGVLPGYTPGRDVHDFFSPTGGAIHLSGGEGIARPEVVRGMGEGAFNNLNRVARTGGVQGVRRALGEGAQFANGGVLAFKKGGVAGDEAIKRIDRTLAAFRPEHGKPYQYGGTGNPSWDCSGLWSGVVRELNQPGTMRNGRLFNTESNFSRFGFEPGLNGPVTIGVLSGAGGGESGHMAGTLNGTNVESSGSYGVQIGGKARGSSNSMFNHTYTLAEFVGDFVDGGSGGGFSIFNAAKKLWDKIIGKIGNFTGPGEWAKIPGAFLAKAKDMVWEKLKSLLPFGGGGDSGGNVEMYRGLVERLLREKGQPVSLADSVLRRMQQESGGNPHAINNWDSNAAKGTPSKGLMQTIDSTFQSYKDPGFDDIWDPESNIRASMNYALAQYGSLSAAYDRAGGYANGGILPAFLRDSGGVLPNNSVAVNMSGHDEWVFNSDQIDKFKESLRHLDESASKFQEGVNRFVQGEDDKEEKDRMRLGAPIEWGAQFLGDILSDVTEDIGSPWGIDGTKAPDILDNQGRVKVSVAGPADDPGRSVLPPVEVHVNMNGDNMTVSSDDVRRGVNQALADYQRRIEALERGVQINTFTTPMVV